MDNDITKLRIIIIFRECAAFLMLLLVCMFAVPQCCLNRLNKIEIKSVCYVHIYKPQKLSLVRTLFF